MDPDPSKLFRSAAETDLIVKEIRDSIVVKLHTYLGTSLPHQDKVSDQQKVVLIADAKATNFSRSSISEIQQLSPSIWAEP